MCCVDGAAGGSDTESDGNADSSKQKEDTAADTVDGETKKHQMVRPPLT